MGFLEEAAGAFAAVEAAKKLDPNAGILAEGTAAVAGFGGVEAIEGMIEKRHDNNADQNSDQNNDQNNDQS